MSEQVVLHIRTFPYNITEYGVNVQYICQCYFCYLLLSSCLLAVNNSVKQTPAYTIGQLLIVSIY